ncbi:MAG TPA: Na+/H+ antiporter NhaA [Planctomycetes bacterium]|nr:Na+/H+ antiporter NhaA [Planctomycetota bacterium]
MHQSNDLQHQHPPAPAQPPPIAKLLGPFTRFLHLSSAGGLLVLGCTAIALIAANSPWQPAIDHLLHAPIGLRLGEGLYEKSLWHLINDGLMAVFFLMVGLEIKRELLLGELRDPRKAALPLAAALGGMAVPALIYVAFNHGGPGAAGWGIPMATDIAFALGIMRLAGRVPSSLLVFLAALAIIDDLGAVVVIALFYTNTISLSALAVAGLAFAGLLLLGRLGVRHPLPFIVGGIVLWLGVLNSGVHATVAGVLLALTIPISGTVDPDRTIGWTADFAEAERKTPNTGDTIERLAEGVGRGRSPLVAWEHALGPWVNFVIVPVFALANAGVVFDRAMLAAVGDPVFWGTLLGLVVGKPIGVVAASLLAVRLGWAALPDGLGRQGIVAAGVLAGVGFTMAIFITGLAFGETDPAHTAIAKAAILGASLIAGVVGFILCRRLGTQAA